MLVGDMTTGEHISSRARRDNRMRHRGVSDKRSHHQVINTGYVVGSCSSVPQHHHEAIWVRATAQSSKQQVTRRVAGVIAQHARLLSRLVECGRTAGALAIQS